MAKRKNPAAVAMARKRWKGITKQERSNLMRAAVNVRWENARKEREKTAKKLVRVLLENRATA